MRQIVYAKSKYIRSSARKARLVINIVRGRNALEAAEMLAFVNKKAAGSIKTTLESAIANAVNNNSMDKKKLEIIEARIDEAPTFKRGRAVSKGRYYKILKRNCHIIIGVSDGSEIMDKKKKAKTKKKANGMKSNQDPSTRKVKKVKAKTVDKTQSPRNFGTSQVKSFKTPRRVQSKG